MVSDPNPEDNSYNFSFEVEERPVRLYVSCKAYQTLPLIPIPGEQYTVIIRVINEKPK